MTKLAIGGAMDVVLEPVSGNAKAYLDRAKLEIERVLGFR